jgi:hypothetical protein
MDQSIINELQHGPKTLEELCFRLNAVSSVVLHNLQLLAMREKVRATLLGDYEVWSLA